MRAIRLIALLPGLLLAGDLGAQEPNCNPPWHTVETFKEQLIAIAAPTPAARNTVSGMVSAAFGENPYLA